MTVLTNSQIWDSCLTVAFVNIPQTGLALMGFSWSCHSCLDLLNSVSGSARPETVDWCPTPGAAASHSQEPGVKSQESGNLEIQDSGNLGSSKIKKLQVFKIKLSVAQNVAKVLINGDKHLPAPFAD